MIERVEVLGPPRVLLDDGASIALRATMRDRALAMVAVDGVVTRDRLALVFWADEPDRVARHNVRQLLKRVRRLPWLTGLHTDGEAVRWEVTTDLDGLREVMADRRWGDLAAPRSLLEGIGRGATVEYSNWLRRRRDELAGHWRRASLEAASHLQTAGDPGAAARVLEPWLATDDGGLVVRWMELAVASGDRAAALSGYVRARADVAARLGLDLPERAHALAERLRARPAPPSLSERSIVVGRANDLAALVDLLARPECRLVTLLGPGGIGKTTLARALVNAVAGRYPDGAELVRLESVTAADAAVAAIAATIGTTAAGDGDPLRRLAAVLHDRRMLLVLDNVEHLPAMWADVALLLRACPRLDVVTTSRERLRLGDEWVHDVAGLDDDAAIDLLRARVRRLAPTSNVPDRVALRIVRAVGGSPLGVNLAAPWFRALAAEDVVAAIERDPTILRGGGPDSAPRHRSVSAAMERSWELATPAERQAVEDLSVFVAPFTDELAEAVAGVDAELLLDLVDRSLLERRGARRFRSHPLVRRHAAARLAADDRRGRSVRRRHAATMLGRLATADGPGLAADVDEIAAAAQYAAGEDPSMLAPVVSSLVELLVTARRAGDGARLLDEIVAQTGWAEEPPSVAAATLLTGAATLLRRLGRHRDARSTAQRAVDIATRTGDDAVRVKAVVEMGWAAKWVAGDVTQHAVTRSVLRTAERIGDRTMLGEVLQGLGCSAPTLEQCRDHLRRGLDVVGDADDGLVTSLHVNLGMVEWGLGDHDVAESLIRAARRTAVRAGLTRWVAWATCDLAFLAAERGDLSEAAALAREAEELIVDGDGADVAVQTWLVGGEVHRLRGDRAGATSRMRRALRVADAVGADASVLRALRLHGLLLLDDGDVVEGLAVLAHVVTHTGRRGDFTSEVLDPRAWDEAVAGVGGDVVDEARRIAARTDRHALVEVALQAGTGGSD